VVGDRIRRLRQDRGWSLAELRAQVLKPEGGHYSAGYFSRL
jgi:transcriptional regulator with XRE-family HTH domain